MLVRSWAGWLAVRLWSKTQFLFFFFFSEKSTINAPGKAAQTIAETWRKEKTKSRHHLQVFILFPQWTLWPNTLILRNDAQPQIKATYFNNKDGKFVTCSHHTIPLDKILLRRQGRQDNLVRSRHHGLPSSLPASHLLYKIFRFPFYSENMEWIMFLPPP